MTLCMAVAGGAVFSVLPIPLPWTLGPIVVVSLVALKTGKRVYWPLKIRDTALILLGYAMGRPFTIETGQAIMSQLPIMLCATLLTVAAGILTGYITYRRTGINLTSCLLGCVPGGLSQMVILAAEMKNTDATAVTIMQTVRMLSVVFVVPFLTMHILPPADAGGNMVSQVLLAPDTTTIMTFAIVAIVGAVAGKMIHLPTAALLGPILSTGAYILMTGSIAPLVPDIYLDIAQICVGAYIGSSINLAKVRQYHSMGGSLFGGVGFVLCVSLCMGYVVAEVTGAAFATAFLSTAPGGLAEMGITALSVGADISTMTAYQLVRLIFIMMVFPYIAKGLVMIHERKNGKFLRKNN
jgi:uncharacterized protein